MATSLLGLGLTLQCGTATAQEWPAQSTWPGGSPSGSPYAARQSPAPGDVYAQPAPAPQQAQTLQFHRDPVGTSPVPANNPFAVQDIVQTTGKDLQQSLQQKSYDSTLEFRGVREVPGVEVLFRMETEENMRRRMQQEALKYGEKLIFPDEPALAKDQYPGRYWAPKAMIVEPSYIAHGRLLFEQQNFERGLWDFGVLTPFMCVGKFYWDVALLPYNLGTRPCQQVETSAGKCLPGDPTPFRLYPFEWSFSGAVCEAAAVTGLLFIFP